MDAMEFYKGLGFNDDQSYVLSKYSYDNPKLALAIRMYKGSIDQETGMSFCESLRNYMQSNPNDVLDDYIKHIVGAIYPNSGSGEVVEQQVRETEALNILAELNGEYRPKAASRGSQFNLFRSFGNLFGGAAGMSAKSESSFSGSDIFSETAPAVSLDEDVDEDWALYADVGLDEDGAVEICSAEPGLAGAETFAVMDAMSEESASFFSGSNIFSEIAPNDAMDNIRTDNYAPIEEKGFISPLSTPTSTFRTTCNTASLGILKNNVLNGTGHIDTSMVRIEELLNYYKYNNNDNVTTDGKIGISAEIFNRPSSNNKMMLVKIFGETSIPSRQNIVILLDTSGSMSGREKNTQAAIFAIISKLNDGDKVSLITYSSDDHIIIDDMEFTKDKMNTIIEKVLAIKIDGCTYGSKGMDSAYSLIESNKISDGINRVILITDGDLNFGVTGASNLSEFISDKKETGAYISVIGTGTFNLNDESLEAIAKNGNGNYCVVNSIDDANESINLNYCSLVYTVATDVKAQVEFNPKYVKSYRLIGFENRALNHADFRNDDVISEPFCSGSYCIALYELDMHEDGNTEEVHSELKYQTPVISNSNEICTIYARYKNLGETKSVEVSHIVSDNLEITDSDNTKLAYVIFVVGEKFRKSSYIGNSDIKTAKRLLKSLSGTDIAKLNGDKMKLLERLLDE